ncbi:MAG TPA: RidA family protein [Alphaproteobacteria bacterium]|jgi:enamine deaminase RidA (YjgF/YER057c/UK114 family)
MSHRQIFSGNGLPKHPQPFPTAARVGNMVFSSAIGGQDAETGKAPDAPEAQIQNAFVHLQTIMRLAGGKPSDIGKVTVHLKDKSHRELVNAEWIKTFPKEEDRPVRHTVSATELPSNLIIQLEFIAVLEA